MYQKSWEYCYVKRFEIKYYLYILKEYLKFNTGLRLKRLESDSI